MNKQTKLAELLSEVVEEHHKAFESTNGNDPMWALWYAKQLSASPEFADLLDRRVEVDELADLLTELDTAFQAHKKESSWQRYYAKELLKIK